MQDEKSRKMDNGAADPGKESAAPAGSQKEPPTVPVYHEADGQTIPHAADQTADNLPRSPIDPGRHVSPEGRTPPILLDDLVELMVNDYHPVQWPEEVGGLTFEYRPTWRGPVYAVLVNQAQSPQAQRDSMALAIAAIALRAGDNLAVLPDAPAADRMQILPYDRRGVREIADELLAPLNLLLFTILQTKCADPVALAAQFDVPVELITRRVERLSEDHPEVEGELAVSAEKLVRMVFQEKKADPVAIARDLPGTAHHPIHVQAVETVTRRLQWLGFTPLESAEQQARPEAAGEGPDAIKPVWSCSDLTDAQMLEICEHLDAALKLLGVRLMSDYPLAPDIQGIYIRRDESVQDTLITRLHPAPGFSGTGFETELLVKARAIAVNLSIGNYCRGCQEAEAVWTWEDKHLEEGGVPLAHCRVHEPLNPCGQCTMRGACEALARQSEGKSDSPSEKPSSQAAA